MPIKKRVKNNMHLVEDSINNRAEQFVTAVAGAGAAEAMRLTPREYGTLANSQFISIASTGSGYRAMVGYTANYAAYLNGLPGYAEPSWSPRPVGQKRGPSANMNAEPGFLNKGFESSRMEATIKDLENIFKV